MRRFVLLTCLLLGLSGCASRQLTPDQKSSFKRVSVAAVKMPTKPTIFGENAAAAFLLGGPLGAALANAGSDIPTLYSQQLRKNNVDVAALLRADLAEQLKQRGFDVVPHGQPVDAILVPEIGQYGLTGDIFASPPVRFPQLSFQVDLNKFGSGDRIWRGGASVNVLPEAYRQLEARRIEEYLQDGGLLRQQVEKASKLMAEAAMAKL